MKTTHIMLVTAQNIDEVLRRIDEAMSGKRYWSGLAIGDIKSIKDSWEVDWFRNIGKFDRVFTATVEKNGSKGDFVIKYQHEETGATPTENVYRCEDCLEVTINENDVLIHQRANTKFPKRGTTSMYMEWTEQRNEFYKEKIK